MLKSAARGQTKAPLSWDGAERGKCFHGKLGARCASKLIAAKPDDRKMTARGNKRQKDAPPQKGGQGGAKACN